MTIAACRAKLNNRLFNLIHPFCWRRRTRRLFLIMWPVAVPAWPLAFVVLLLGCLALAVFARIERFWNQPRQYRVRYNTYGYDVRSRGFEIRLKTAPPPQPHIGDEVETVTRRTMMMS